MYPPLIINSTLFESVIATAYWNTGFWLVNRRSQSLLSRNRKRSGSHHCVLTSFRALILKPGSWTKNRADTLIIEGIVGVPFARLVPVESVLTLRLLSVEVRIRGERLEYSKTVFSLRDAGCKYWELKFKTQIVWSKDQLRFTTT